MNESGTYRKVLMKVSELREKIKDYSKNDLEKVLVELYKSIPKKIKEEKEVDDIIVNAGKPVTLKKDIIDYDDLANEVLSFISNVDDGLYARPNRIISKTERSKWRFKVKNYYKNLIKIPLDSENGIGATNLLIMLYNRLSTGSIYLAFSSWNTFGALGISQNDYFYTLMSRILFNGIDKNSLTKCALILNNYTDSNNFSKANYYTFRSFLNTVEEKKLGIEVLLELKGSIKNKLSKINGDSLKYEYNNRISLIDSCIMEIYFTMNMVFEGIKYINSASAKKKSDIYNLILSSLKEEELYKDWLKIYEKFKNLFPSYYDVHDDYEEIKNKV